MPHPNGLLIGPAVFAQLIRVRLTDTQTTLRATRVAKARIHATRYGLLHFRIRA